MERYGLIGYPLGHSFSNRYFNDKFEREGIEATYELFPLENLSTLPTLIESDKKLRGLNVTIPYKEEVFKYLTKLSPEATSIGAVNVIKLQNKGEGIDLVGYNSDYIGFKESLLPLLHSEVKEALILGTGGASKAVAFALKELGIAYKFVSRSRGDLTYADLNPDIIKSYLLIVNTTPLGMYPNVTGCPTIPYSALTPHHICYDLVYNPEITEFMKKSTKYGATVKNGLEMLHRQAEAAWKIWQRP